MTAVIEVLHWASLAAAAAFSLRLFRDLAASSRWLVQAPRSSRVATFHHRHRILATIFSLWIAAFLSRLIADVGYGPAFWLLTATSAIGCIAGFVNPRAADSVAPPPTDQARE